MGDNGKSRRNSARRRRNGINHGFFIISFTCGCYVHLKRVPQIGEEAYCPVHKKVVNVAARKGEYWFSCHDCHYRRTHGHSEAIATADAAKHARTRRHRLSVYCGKKFVVSVGDRDPAQLELDLGDDPPPF